MSKNWSPTKEHKGPQHQKDSYIHNVMKDKKGEDGLKGNIDSKGGSNNGLFPKPPYKPSKGNNGKSPWNKGKQGE